MNIYKFAVTTFVFISICLASLIVHSDDFPIGGTWKPSKTECTDVPLLQNLINKPKVLVATDNNGRIIVSTFGSIASSWPLWVMRFDKDGSIDESFGADGLATSEEEFLGEPMHILIRPDNDILIKREWGISKLTSNGDVDLSFGEKGYKTNQEFGKDYFILDNANNGEIVMVSSKFIALADVNGKIIKEFESTENDEFRDVKVDETGSIFVFGLEDEAVKPTIPKDIVVYKFTPSLTPDLAFGSGGKVYAGYKTENSLFKIKYDQIKGYILADKVYMLFNIVVGRHDAPNYLLIYAMDSKTGNSDQDIIEITSQLDEPLESVHSIMNYLAFIYNAKKEYFIEFDEGKLIGYNSNTSLLYMEPYLILDNSRLASVEVDSATGKLCIKFFARQMPLGELMQKEDDIKINKGPAISPSNLSKHKNKQPVIERIKEATHMHILPNTKQEKEDEYKVDIKDKKKKIKTIEPYWKKLIYGNTDR